LNDFEHGKLRMFEVNRKVKHLCFLTQKFIKNIQNDILRF